MPVTPQGHGFRHKGDAVGYATNQAVINETPDSTLVSGDTERSRCTDALSFTGMRDHSASSVLHAVADNLSALGNTAGTETLPTLGSLAGVRDTSATTGFAGQPDLMVPALSLSEWRDALASNDAVGKLRFAQALDDAFGRYGFVAIVDHGIQPDVLDRAYGVTEAFFRLPLAEKSQLIVPGADGQRGFTAGGETAIGAAAPDLKEFVQLGLTRNPAPSQIPDFLSALGQLQASFEEIASNLLAAMSFFQVGDTAQLPEAVCTDRSILRLIHYPALNDQVPSFSERAAAHEDICLITLLLNARAMSGSGEATGRGLQLKVPLNGKRAELAEAHEMGWVNAIVPKDSLIVNVGEMLERWTNGAWRATTHRVVNPELGDPERTASRLSMPYFVHPRADFSLAPHPRSVANAGGEQRYTEVTAEQALQQRLSELGLRQAST
jgi:isopenicillin N synthase-like dioxygenase